jgi:GT2 family glycosyltransferase
MIPEAGCLESHWVAHQIEGNRIIVGSIPDLSETTDFQRYRKFLSAKWEKPLMEFREKPMDSAHIYLSAANFSIKAADFKRMSGFDPRINDAEDFDFAVRSFGVGLPIVFVPRAKAWHNDPVSVTSYVKRLRQYRNSHQRLRSLEPLRYQAVPFHEPKSPRGLKGLLFRFFARRVWITAIEKQIFLHFLPRSLRYKLYDLIVTANGSFYPDKVSID